ncbi:MAG: glycoside hydrolase family 127 protein [Bacteroidales bacterium]|nr:glycoside hydrolase family 127 protein [Bacteroidales bacterium]
MKTSVRLVISSIAVISMLFISCQNNDSVDGDYPITPVAFNQVNLHDNFWEPRIRMNHELTIPFAFRKSEETGRIKNFEVAAGWEKGSFCSLYPFDDSDVYKIIEGASYSLQMYPDAELDAYLDDLILKIGGAQEEDGYLYTNRTIMGDSAHPWAGSRRWELTNVLSHELYNLGHLYEAGVAHYQTTGKTSLLDICTKSADLLVKDFGWGKEENYPGHQEVEIGLVKLYRVTGKKEYLDLAKFFLDVRKGGEEYSQSHIPVIEQKEAVGHAVRANYMYTGMADVAALTGATDYIHAIDTIWNNVVSKKLYITGGVGVGGHGEGYGENYELPNMNAYCETCASIANVFWNERMFLLHGDAKYLNVLERVLYNGVLSGLGLSGDRFFYPNPLKSKGQHERSAWFGCACCPSNLTRFLPSIPGYMYAVKGSKVFVNLYASSSANLVVKDTKLEILQETNYPWDGKIKVVVNPQKSEKFTLMCRIPGWAQDEAVPSDLYTFIDKPKGGVKLSVNGKSVKVKIENGFAVVKRRWNKADELILDIPMDIKRIKANEHVESDAGQVAIQRGPLVYCLEWPDQEEEKVLHMALSENPHFDYSFNPDILNGVGLITTTGYSLRKDLEGDVAKTKKVITAIPYYSWANRGKGEMTVWIPESIDAATPLPAPTIASKAKLSSSPAKGSLGTITDQLIPEKSSSKEYGIIHWWPNFGNTEWVVMEFEQAENISQTEIFWFDDEDLNAGCRVPESYKIFYKSRGAWIPLSPLHGYPNKKDEFNLIDFSPITTTALKLEILEQQKFSTGMQEWVVK